MSFGIEIIQTLQPFKVCFCISDFASMTPRSLIMPKHQYYIIKCAPSMHRHNRKVKAKQAQLLMFVHLLTCSTHLFFCSFELSPEKKKSAVAFMAWHDTGAFQLRVYLEHKQRLCCGYFSLFKYSSRLPVSSSLWMWGNWLRAAGGDAENKLSHAAAPAEGAHGERLTPADGFM